MSSKQGKLLRLESLLDRRRKVRLKDELSNPTEKSNPNYRHLHENINNPDVAGSILEGSSRSGKTWSSADKIIHICTEIEVSCTINIYRQTYAEFKETLYEDFKRRLDDFDLDNPFKRLQEVKSFKIGKNKITFIGCDRLGSKHGAGCDYAFFNEMMHIDNSVFDQVEMRCRKYWWGDYNPSATEHYIFDKVVTRRDVTFLRTTFLDNPHISPKERNKILSYEPWETNSYKVVDNEIIYNGLPVDENNQPPPNIDNIDQGTADEFMWKVYGLGLRGAMKGQIYKHVKWIDKFPEGVGYHYGVDFGFTSDPSTIVKYARVGKSIYKQLLWYAPTETANDMENALIHAGVTKYDPITADSSDKYTSEKKGTVQMVRDLQDRGWEIHKVSKTKGVTYWVLDVRDYTIHIVKDMTSDEGKKMYQAAKKEQENYKWQEINGIQINQPIDKWDHFWNGGRYAHMNHSRNTTQINW